MGRGRTMLDAGRLGCVEMQQNIPLAPLTTFGIGGPAQWFAAVTCENDVSSAVNFAREHGLPLLVLGGGSNLLIADSGFRGVVLHMAMCGIEVSSLEDGATLVAAAAGESWDGLVQFAVDRDLAGMECLAGIPGTVGGTPVQNVGAYGQEVAETVRTVRCFDTQTSSFVELSNADCGFAYRASRLNTAERERYIVTRVDFGLTPHGAPKLAYADLRKHFAGQARPSLRETAEAVRQIRRGKSMVIDPADPNTRSAGSFFRNPVVAEGLLANISEAAGVPLADVPRWPAADGHVKLPAAWLLERAGFVRGYAMGEAAISTRHTLALINRGGAAAVDILALKDRIVTTVEQRFGITLEQEPVAVG